MTRAIIHADLDAFYASVEQLDRPELSGRPVVVGGPPEHRGVVAAASYEARRYGVHSAMPMRTALRLCPPAVRVSPRFSRYSELSGQIMAIFRGLTPLVEPLSLDEAFLDITDRVSTERGAEAMARWLKLEVKRATGLVVSVGLGTSKSVAKIASDAGKPDGFVIVRPGEEEAFLAPLPARALWRIGPKAEERLASAGISTIGALAAADPVLLQSLLGSWGPLIGRMAAGDDPRQVQPAQRRKSVGAETTFSRDLPDGPELRAALELLAARTVEHLDGAGLRAGTVGLKLRYSDFRTITRQESAGPYQGAEVFAAAGRLLDAVARPGDRFRLIGVQCSRLEAEGQTQLALWADSSVGE